MWPELLKWPINQPFTTRDKAESFLHKIGAYKVLRELRYQLSYLCYFSKEGRR